MLLWTVSSLPPDYRTRRAPGPKTLSRTIVWGVGLFTGVALLMGSPGPAPVAAHQIAFNYAALLVVVPLGISMATTVRVGHALGGGAPWPEFGCPARLK